METTIILGALLIGLLIINFSYREIRYFNANRFKNGYKDKIVPIEFCVIKVEEDRTQFENEHPIQKTLWKYTIGCHFFLKTNNKKFIYDKYIFWDEPEKYKVGDILTLTNIK